MRLALEGSEWELDAVPPQAARSLSDALREAAPPAVLLVSAAEILDCYSQDHHPPSGVSVLLHGDPGLIPALSDVRFDDYLADPWTREELLFRLRRVAGGRSLRCRSGSLSWGRYWVAATGADSVRVSAPLTPAQFSVLDLLGRYAGESVARETMLAGLPESQEGGRALDMHVSRLRSRIADVTVGWPESPHIRSQRRYGYCLEIV
ncbi:MAG: winged helix-turn-helix domain-containing protein [Spirochaetota bacterium]